MAQTRVRGRGYGDGASPLGLVWCPRYSRGTGDGVVDGVCSVCVYVGSDISAYPEQTPTMLRDVLLARLSSCRLLAMASPHWMLVVSS